MLQRVSVSPPTTVIKANFSGSNIGVSGFYPPDSDGVVGPDEFVELVNGLYRVYDKLGNMLQQSTLDDFWAAAGVAQAGAFDPRIVYDPESQRWFAAAMTFTGVSGDNPSAFLLGVSKTSDPTQGWQGFEFGQTFDFTELGFNRDGVYLAATDGSGGNIDFVSIPKADLLAAHSSVANASFFTTFFGNTGPAPQPAVAPSAGGSEALLGLGPDFLKISSIDSPLSSPTLNTQDDRKITVPDGFQNTAGAVQQGSTIPVNTGNLIFSSNVVIADGKLFAVETVAQGADQSHPALRWFVIGDPFTAPVVLDSGMISPPGLDVYYGSIAVNPLGQVVIGFSASGPNEYPSAYAVAGILTGDILQFGDPILLKAGVAPETSGRFGDYSTTSYDPTDPTHFWTIQEWTSASGWSTQIAEIVFTPPTFTPAGPAVTSVTTSGNGITGGTGDLNVGAVVLLTLHMSEPVAVVGGLPTLQLNDGGVATYAGGSGSNALVFSYTVAAGDNTPDLAITAVDLNGALIVNSPAAITPASGGSLTDAYGHVFSFGALYQGGDYHILRDGVPDGAGATLTLVHGVVYDHTTSFGWYADSAGQFIYQQTAPVLDTAADLSGAVTNPAGILQIDTNGTPAGPAVTSVTTSGNGITGGTGDLNVGAVVLLTLHMSEPVAVVGGLPTLQLNDGGVATYAGGSGSNALVFSYTVAAGDNTPDLAITAVDLNGALIVNSPAAITPASGGSLTDAYGHVFSFGALYQGGDYHILRDGVPDGAGATLTLVHGVVYDHTTSFGWYADSAGQFIYQQTAPVLDTAADLSGAVTNPAGILQIDTNGTPAGPAVTSVTTSGNGITGGTGDLNVGAVVLLTLHMSEPVAVVGGLPTLQLNDGGVATYAGGSGSNALVFSYTVAAGDNTPDLAITAVDLNGALIVNSPAAITPASGGSLTDAYGHVFSFGALYQGGDYHILRDGVPDGAGATLTLVHGVVYDHTTSFGWYADSAGQFIYQQTAPVLDTAADLSGAVTNPAGILQIDTNGTPAGPAVTSVTTSGNGITGGTGDLNVGAVVLLTLHMSEPVAVVGGLPTLQLNDGGVATYAGGSGSNALVFSYTVAAGDNTPDLAITAVDLNGALIVNSPAAITPASGGSLTDAYGHVFSFGALYQGGDYHILRDGVPDGAGATLTLVHGVVYDHTTSFGWYADSAGQFIYQQTAPVLDTAADLSGAVTNPAGILQIDTNGTPAGPAVTSAIQAHGPETIAPGTGASLTDAYGHVFSFGNLYQGGDYHILRDGVPDGAGATLTLVHGVVYDDTTSFGWYADSEGHFIYQQTAPDGVGAGAPHLASFAQPTDTHVSGGQTLGLAAAYLLGVSIDNAGTVEVSGAAASTLDFVNVINTASASLKVDPGSTLEIVNTTLQGGSFDNAGLLNATAGSSLLNSATATNSGTIEVHSGTLTIASGSFTNSGHLLANGGNLVVAQDVSGTGSASIAGSNAVLELGGASSQNVAFEASAQGGTLVLDDAPGYAGHVAGFKFGNMIDLPNFKFADNPLITSVTGTGDAGSITNVIVHDGVQNVTLHLLNEFANEFIADPGAYVLANDNTAAHGTLFELHA